MPIDHSQEKIHYQSLKQNQTNPENDLSSTVLMQDIEVGAH